MKHHIHVGLQLAAMCTICALSVSPSWAHEADSANTLKAATPKKASNKAFKTLPQKSNGSGVRVAYRLESVPQVGKPLTITLQADTALRQGATLELVADKEMRVQTMTGGKMALAAKQSNTQQIVVVPQQEGLFYVNVFTEHEGRKSASAIAVRVGNKPLVLPTVGEVKTDANGQKVISMQAQ